MSHICMGLLQMECAVVPSDCANKTDEEKT